MGLQERGIDRGDTAEGVCVLNMATTSLPPCGGSRLVVAAGQPAGRPKIRRSSLLDKINQSIRSPVSPYLSMALRSRP